MKMDNTLFSIAFSSVVAFVIGYVVKSWTVSNSTQISAPKVNQNELNDEDEFDDDGDHKMVLVVRMDLKMGKGKVAAQVGHATLGAYKRGLKNIPGLVKAWSKGGQAKVVVKVNTEKEILDVEKAAKQLGVNTYLVMDAGRTQIASGSKTVLAVGPDTAERVDKVTGNLKLL